LLSVWKGKVFVGLVQWQAVGCFQTGRSRCFEGWGWGPWWVAVAPMADQVGPLWSCLKIIVAILYSLRPSLIARLEFKLFSKLIDHVGLNMIDTCSSRSTSFLLFYFLFPCTVKDGILKNNKKT